MEKSMKPGIEMFVSVVPHCSELDKVLNAIQFLRMAKSYRCPTASTFALHLIFDLYDEDSSRAANTMRMTTNLEAAADDLVYFSKRLKEIG
jgi:hypothetical protein